MKLSEIEIGVEYAAVSSSPKYDVKKRVEVVAIEKTVIESKRSWQGPETKTRVRVKNVTKETFNLGRYFASSVKPGETILVESRQIVAKWADVVSARNAQDEARRLSQVSADNIMSRVEALGLTEFVYYHPSTDGGWGSGRARVSMNLSQAQLEELLDLLETK